MAPARSTVGTVGIAFAVGSLVGLFWMAMTKRSVEREYAAGARALREELERRGSSLREEIANFAAERAVEAVYEELADLGITEGMLRDLERALELVRS